MRVLCRVRSGYHVGVVLCVLVGGVPTHRNAMFPTYAGKRHAKIDLMTKSERITVAYIETW